MDSNSKEYKILYIKYKNLLESPRWKATQTLRDFLDSVKKKFNRNYSKVPSGYSPGSFEDLLYEYNSILNSKCYRLMMPFTKKEIEVKEDDIENEDAKENNNSFQDIEYENWLNKNEKIEDNSINLKYKPLISVLIPIYNVKPKYLRCCINSVLEQYYQNFELILIDDKSTSKKTIECINTYKSNRKIKIINRNRNGGISEATNSGLEKAKGEFICLLDDDDLLSKNALSEYVLALNQNRNIDLLYSDEDKIDSTGNYRFYPSFKPEYSPDLLMNNNYICHFLMMRKSICDKVGAFNYKFDGAQDYDYVLRFVEKTKPSKIKHINKVLYHWRAIPGSTALDMNEKKDIIKITKLVKENAIERRKLNAYVEEDGNIYYRSNNKKISIIIPSKDNFDYLKKCIDSIITKSNYNNYEILVIDNGSSAGNKKIIKEYLDKFSLVTYIYKKMPFNYSSMNNIGVKQAKGDYFLFLNDDIEIIREDWLDRLVGYASQNHIGAVGLKLLYPNSTTVQHCGILNSFPGPTSYFVGYDDNMILYRHFNRICTNVLAVTGACLMISKDKYNEIGGFDEELAISYNDVDLCVRLYKKGYANVVLNNIYLYHAESVSRITSNLRKNLLETREFYNKHPDLYLQDPYYNEALQLGRTDFIL